jgi:hypothetical protein
MTEEVEEETAATGWHRLMETRNHEAVVAAAVPRVAAAVGYWALTTTRP